MVMQASCGPARAREDDTAVGRCGRRLMTSAILPALIPQPCKLEGNFLELQSVLKCERWVVWDGLVIVHHTSRAKYLGIPERAWALLGGD